jgi:hypothetical protein
VDVLKAIAHRPMQACVIVMLSALVSTCAVFTPLYQRALDQASARSELQRATAGADLLQVVSDGVVPTTINGEDSPIPALSPSALDRELPAKLDRVLVPPVAARFVQLSMPDGTGHPASGSLVWRADACAHVTLLTGACPTGVGQILVSAADAENFGWTTGTTLPTIEEQPKEALDPAATMTLTVTGVYRPTADRYWDGWTPTGASGTTPDRGKVLHDTWLTDRATFDSTPVWRNPSTQLDYAVDPAISVDDLVMLGEGVAAYSRDVPARHLYGAPVRAQSGIPAIAVAVQKAEDQSRVTIPALMVPLGVLGLVVLWMALGAAIEERRPEVAVARLRGRGVRGAQAHLLRELLPLVLLGVPVGVLAAFGLSWAARVLLLPDGVPTEMRMSVAVAVLLAAAVVSATAVVVSAQISREPIVGLLRRVPGRRPGWGLGTADAVLLTAAFSILGAFTTGHLTGPVALAGPAVLALAAGLLLARLLVPVSTWLGRRLLARGTVAPAVAVLQLARRPGVRATIALLTVAAGILAFAVDAVSVGARNRELAAAQQVGAPMVASVTGGGVAALQDAVRAARTPTHDMTAVVLHRQLSDEDQTNLFVDPEAFRRIATFPDDGAAAAATSHLAPPAVEPIRLVGTRVTARVSTENFYEGSSRPVDLALQMLSHDGVPAVVRLGPLPVGTSVPRRMQAEVDCSDGCVLTGWLLLTDPANDGIGRVTVTGLHTDSGGRVDLGTTADWPKHNVGEVRAMAMEADGNSLTMYLDNPGATEVLLQHRWVPTELPTAVTGSLPEDSDGTEYDGKGLDGVTRRMQVVDRLPWLPSVGSNAALSDLDAATRTGSVLDDRTELQIWFADEDAGALARARTALEARQMSVTDVRRTSATRDVLDDTAAGWSLQLGVLAGAAALVVAALGLAVAGAASWRPRTRDLAVLELNGMSMRTLRRISLGEQAPAIAAAVLSGAAVGVVAAHYALPTLPLLPDDPPVDLVDLSTAWPTLLVVVPLTVVVLCVVGALVGGIIVRRTRVDRVVGTP